MIRTTDITPELFAQFVRESGVGKWFVEDGDGSDFDMDDVPGSVYGAAICPDTMMVFAAQPLNSAAMHLHIAAHPEQNAQAALAARECLAHVRRVVGKDVTLFTFTPSDNEAAQALNKLMGFRHVGTLHGGYRRGVTRLDMEIYEDA